MSKKALFPGSFDPITKGHQDIVLKGLQIFDEIIIGIGHHASKKSMFTVEQRIQTIQSVFKDEPRVKIMSYDTLTVKFCLAVGAKFILRGLRSGLDFEYEQSIAYANKELENEVETVFLLSSPSYSNISSTIVRDIILHKGDYAKFVPNGVRFEI